MYLEKISSSQDIKKLSLDELEILADEIRKYMIDVVSKTGGHIAPSLGTVDLTVALHYVFDLPSDKIIWDVGHQTYAHKILSGRKEKFKKLRQSDGISGFLSIFESEYDAFGAGHSSTSISAAYGIREALDMKGKSNKKVLAVIGDGSLTSGVAFEALNNTGNIRKNFTVILNDNGMSIAKNVGILSSYLSKKMTGRFMTKARFEIKKSLEKFGGDRTSNFVKRIEEAVKIVISPSALFEAFGYTYVGPVDGHNIKELVSVLENTKIQKKPILLHVLTKKGYGYKPAEDDPETFHGLGPFDIESGKLLKKSKIPSYTQIFSKTLIDLAEKDKDIISITAAMPSGTGLNKFKEIFPDRFFDVGIAEQHAVIFAAAAALEGLKPFVTIYSTFLQRSFDQLVHDVAIQNLPVTFAIDRGGLVGEDGPTHHGIFDLSYIRLIPNFIIAVPKDENELKNMLYSSLKWEGPKAIRYPRGKIQEVELSKDYEFIEKGTWEIIQEGNDGVVFATGSTFYPAKEAVKKLEKAGKKLTLVNARFIKPLDYNILNKLSDNKIFFTIEENTVIGGFGSAVAEYYSAFGNKVFIHGIKDKFSGIGTQEELRKIEKLDSDSIKTFIESKLTNTTDENKKKS